MNDIRYIIRKTSEWINTSSRHTLIPEGCLCIELLNDNDMKIKIGDGKRKFHELPYISSEQIDLSEYITTEHLNDILKDYSTTEYVDDRITESKYTLPIANKTTLGGVKTASDITTSDGLTPIPIIDGVPYYSGNQSNVPPAGNEFGLVKSGEDVTITNGLVSVNDNSHNHTISNITNLQNELLNKLSTTLKGSSNGLAELDSTGKVPLLQLPESFGGSIIEGYYYNDKFYQDIDHSIEIIGESNMLYIDKSTSKSYRHNNGTFIMIISTGEKGETGPIGPPGPQGETGPTGATGDRGEIGPKGDNGPEGEPGKTAYQIAIDNGFTGTEIEWLDSLNGSDGKDGSNGIDGLDGTDGKSAYEIALQNGFIGSQEEWLIYLKGKDGSNGIDGIDGQDGVPGRDGVDGVSVYQIAVNNGFVGNEYDWLISLKGPKGDTGSKGDTGDTGPKGDKGDAGEQGIQGLKGDKGDKGDTGSQGERGLRGLKGDKGDPGADGAGAVVVNNLTSTSTTSALSANQGRVLNAISANKVSKVDGKDLSTNDYTNVDKTIVSRIRSGTGTNALTIGKTTNLADGTYSFSIGNSTSATGAYSFAAGYGTIANQCQTVLGKYNVTSSGPAVSNFTGSVLIVGKGTSVTQANCFRVGTNGVIYSTGAYNTTGADYAEYFEWEDGNINNEDRRGLFVTLSGKKIKIANSDDDYILGVVSSNPSVIGDSHDDQWKGMFMVDVFGSPILEEVEEIVYSEPEYDEDGNITIEPVEIDRYTVMTQKINPEYDNSKEYVPRSQRKEWSAIGIVGKLVIIDDGSCEVNGYCTTTNGGIGTASSSGYRVISRLDETHVEIIIK